MQRMSDRTQRSDQTLLLVLDYAIASQRKPLLDLVFEMINARVQTGQFDFPSLFTLADGKNDEIWIRLLGMAFYRYTTYGPDRWNLDLTR